MKSPNAVYIQDVIGEIVSQVSAEMLPYLQGLYPQITGVHYQYGTGYEIIETLSQMSKNDANVDKYPLICLFLDVAEQFNTDLGIYSVIPNLKLAIINDTQSTFKANERDNENFKPILTPIYESFIRHINFRGDMFQVPSIGVRHDAKRNYFWGREGVYGKEGAAFNDKLDAIELQLKNLKIYSSYCPPSVVV